MDAAARRYADQWAKMKSAWSRQRAAIERKLREAMLHKTFYAPEKITAAVTRMEAWLAPAEAPPDVFAGAELFSQATP